MRPCSAGATKRRGEWRIAPAYDLVFSAGPRGEHTMAVAGEARRPRTADMLRVAETCGIGPGRARELLEETGAAVERWPEFGRAASLPEARIREIGAVFARLRA